MVILSEKSERKRMFLNVFKLYSKELGLESVDEAKFKEDEDVLEVFARGMVLFQGDGTNGVTAGKSDAQSAAISWKVFCHLFQAYSAYLATIARKLQSKGRTTVKSLQYILTCMQSVHASASIDTLSKRLSAQQFRDMYIPHTEYLLSICFETEPMFPISSHEHTLVSSVLKSLLSVLSPQPFLLSPFLITASKYMRTGTKREPSKTAPTVTSFATNITTFVINLLNPTTSSPNGNKEKERRKSTESPTSPTIVNVIPNEALPTVVWFLIDSGLQMIELHLAEDAYYGAWQGLAQCVRKPETPDAQNSDAQNSDNKNSDKKGDSKGNKNTDENSIKQSSLTEWDCSSLIRLILDLQIHTIDPSSDNIDLDFLLEELLNSLNDTTVDNAFAIATVSPSKGTIHMQYCELLSYIPIMALQHTMMYNNNHHNNHHNKHSHKHNNKNNEKTNHLHKSLQLCMNLWQRVHSLLVQKLPIPAPEPKMIALFGMRLTCFTRSLTHIVTFIMTQVRSTLSTPTNLIALKQDVIPSVLETALILLKASLVDTKCVPAVLKSLYAIQTLFAHCASDSVHKISPSLTSLLQHLFERCAELPEAARMDISNIAHACAVQVVQLVLSHTTATSTTTPTTATSTTPGAITSATSAECLHNCVALLVCAVLGAFQTQTSAQQLTFMSKRRDAMRLLIRTLLQPADDHHYADFNYLLPIKKTSPELNEEIKVVLHQHITLFTSTTTSSVQHVEWLCARIDALLQVIHDESDLPIAKLYTTSQLCWNGVLTLSATEITTLLENISNNLRILDVNSYETVFSTTTTAAAKKVTKVKKDVTITGTQERLCSEQLHRVCKLFQLWTLLAIWTNIHSDYISNNDNNDKNDSVSGKYSTNDVASPDPCSQDPMLSRYITAAVQSLRLLEGSLTTMKEEQQDKEVRKVDLLSVVNSIVNQGRQLHALFYLNGRLTDQAQLVKTALLLCQLTEHSVAELTALCDDFRSFALIMSVLNGVYNHTEESALILHVSLPMALNVHQQQVDKFCITCLSLLHSPESNMQQKYLETLQTSHLTSYTNSYQTEKVTLPTCAQEFIVLCKHAYRACTLLQQQQQQQSQIGNNNIPIVSNSWDFLPWVCVLASKVLWIVFQDLSGALTWGSFTSAAVKSKYASNSSRHSGMKSLTSDNSENSENSVLNFTQATIVCDSVLSKLALMEVQLLRAELYEHVGNLDSAFAYLRDATYTAKTLHTTSSTTSSSTSFCTSATSSITMLNIVHLHTIRLWYRTSSPKLQNLVADLLAGAHEDRIYTSHVDVSDEITTRIRAAVLSICALFPSVSSGDTEENVQTETISSKHLANIRYRHLHRFWDVVAAQQRNSGNSKVFALNCMLPPELKTQLRAYLSETSTIHTAPCFSGIDPNSAQSCDTHNNTLLNALTQTAAFDGIRDLRRRMCLHAIHNRDHSLYTFLTGMASCGVAVECWERANTEASGQTQDSAEDKATKTEDGKSGIPRAAQLISDALQQDQESINAVQSRLLSLIRHCHTLHSQNNQVQDHPNQYNTNSAVSFLCFDPVAHCLLLGRYDETGPLVLALPATANAQDLASLLTTWDENQERSKSMLRQGLNVEQAGKLTDAQKRNWWSARQNYDSSVESSMCDLQDLLGVWRIMLSGDRTSSADLSTQCEAALKSAFSDENEVIRVLPWLELIACNLAHASDAKAAISRTMRLSSDEAVVALTQVLTDNQCDRANDKAEKIIKQIIASASELASVPASASARSQKGLNSEEKSEPASKSAKNCPATPSSVVMSTAELNSLKVTELRALLKEAGLDATGKKQDLVDRLYEHYVQQHSIMTTPTALSADLSASYSSSSTSQKSARALSSDATTEREENKDVTRKVSASQARGHVVLVLDEHLQRLPIETMPCLRGANCSRVPSFALLLKLIEDQQCMSNASVDHVSDALDVLSLQPSEPEKTSKSAPKKAASTKGKKGKPEREAIYPLFLPSSAETLSWQKVSVNKAWYALDIEGNLPLTRSTLQPFLNEYQGKWDWTGVIATIPPEKTTQSLHESSDLFIFCGHGAGERMCDPFRLRRFASCPASLLWGCSSGALKAHGVHDALGTALYYMLAGAPFLVANLWDVTDKDIDKLCMAYMRSVFPSPEGESDEINGRKVAEDEPRGQMQVAEALVQCRNVCRMANAVGSAPVLYGIPTLLVDPST